jgi:hypothetical protein
MNEQAGGLRCGKGEGEVDDWRQGRKGEAGIEVVPLFGLPHFALLGSTLGCHFVIVVCLGNDNAYILDMDSEERVWWTIKVSKSELS